MKKEVIILFLMMSLLSLSYASFAQSPPVQERNLIFTEGVAEVMGQNDSARISIAVVTDGKDLEEISREMKREKEIDWERKRSLESTIEKQKKIQEKLQKIEKNLDQAIKKMENNQLFSPELLEKYRQLQNLFQEIVFQYNLKYCPATRYCR